VVKVTTIITLQIVIPAASQEPLTVLFYLCCEINPASRHFITATASPATRSNEVNLNTLYSVPHVSTILDKTIF